MFELAAIDVAKIVSYVVVGGIAGGFVGMLLTGKKAGYGWFKNLGLGVAGGVLGGLLFIELLNLDYGTSDFAVTLQDLIAAVLGTLLLIVLLKIFRRKGKTPA